MKLCTRTIKPTSLRQKSCRHCASAKAKCDLKRSSCSRCTLRGTPCVYAAVPDNDSGLGDSSPSSPTNHYVPPSGTSVPAEVNNVDMMDAFGVDLLHNNFSIDELDGGDSALGLIPFNTSLYNTTLTTTSDFSGLEDPWFLPPDMTPPLVRHSMETLLRALRTWPRILCKGFLLPPMFHHSISRTTVSLPLANCCTLVKMWEVSTVLFVSLLCPGPKPE